MKYIQFKEAILPVVSVLMANFDYEPVKVFRNGCWIFALIPNSNTAVIGDSVIWLLSHVPSFICVTIEIYSHVPGIVRPCIVFSCNK